MEKPVSHADDAISPPGSPPGLRDRKKAQRRADILTNAARLFAQNGIDATTMAELAAEYGLAENEYQVVLDRLGREPNHVELGVFSVMWSEHCSYKSSKIHLGKFPTKGPRVICGPGENAGVIDIDDGDACIFKMESHNHPS
ncbi:MAG: TetR family transcriptional regulator, partial [Thermaurantiacus sp.]